MFQYNVSHLQYSIKGRRFLMNIGKSKQNIFTNNYLNNSLEKIQSSNRALLTLTVNYKKAVLPKYTYFLEYR